MVRFNKKVLEVLLRISLKEKMGPFLKLHHKYLKLFETMKIKISSLRRQTKSSARLDLFKLYILSVRAQI